MLVIEDTKEQKEDEKLGVDIADKARTPPLAPAKETLISIEFGSTISGLGVPVLYLL